MKSKELPPPPKKKHLEIQVGGRGGGQDYAIRNHDDGREVKEVWKSRWEGGGQKLFLSMGEGVDFFSGITQYLSLCITPPWLVPRLNDKGGGLCTGLATLSRKKYYGYRNTGEENVNGFWNETSQATGDMEKII